MERFKYVNVNTFLLHAGSEQSFPFPSYIHHSPPCTYIPFYIYDTYSIVLHFIRSLPLNYLRQDENKKVTYKSGYVYKSNNMCTLVCLLFKMEYKS